MKEDNKKHSQMAGIAGLAVGAAAGVAITALADADKRQKVKRQAKQLADQAQKTWQQVEPEVRQAGHKIKKGLRQIQPTPEISDMAAKGGEAAHQAENLVTEQYKEVKDWSNH
jgi:hypothetical protein